MNKHPTQSSDAPVESVASKNRRARAAAHPPIWQDKSEGWPPIPRGPPRLMRQPEVLALTGLRKSQLQEAVARGAFPRPVKILEAGRAVGWVDSEVFSYIQSRIAARDAVKNEEAAA